MQLCELYLALGQDAFAELLKGVSIGKLKTYQIYERAKIRFHMAKLNSETLRKAAPRLWSRIADEKDNEFAADIAQVVLVSHLDMIIDVLNHLEIPHEEGFFAKDLDAAKYLTEGWQQRAFEGCKDKYQPTLLLFYINHLAIELEKEPQIYQPAAQAS